MPNLESAIAAWRKQMAAAPQLGPDTLDELESHLRETVDQLMRSGLGEAEAFQRAVDQLGPPQTMGAEFQKLGAPRLWLPVRIAGVLMGIAVALVFAFLLSAPFHHTTDVLLSMHVLTINLGYAATWFLGMLGICFVCQRCVSDFPARRLRPLPRFSFSFAAVATTLTAVGIVLGMFWSKRQWGRFWNWDPKELGGLCVLCWLFAFMAAHRFSSMTPRALFVMSVLSGSVVILASLGPFYFPSSLHSYGTPSHVGQVLSVTVLSNLFFFILGFTPAGWLHWRKG